MLNFKPAFSLSSFTLNKRLFSSSLLSAIRVVSYLRLLIFLLAILFKLVAYASWHLAWCMGFPSGSDGKESAYNVEDLSLISGLGRSLGERNGNPLQYSWIPWTEDAAAAAKSLQLCPTLCDSIKSRTPGSPVPGILQERMLEWVDGGYWWAIFHEFTKSWTQLSDFTFTHWRRKW